MALTDINLPLFPYQPPSKRMLVLTVVKADFIFKLHEYPLRLCCISLSLIKVLAGIKRVCTVVEESHLVLNHLQLQSHFLRPEIFIRA